MLISPFIFFVLFMMVFGSLVALSSASWFVAWVGLELNLLSFLPVVFWESGTGSNESGVKYFFIQSLASLFILVGSLFPFFVETFGSFYFVVFSLFVKLGAAPFHFWFVSVVDGMGWLVCLLLMTWQKLAPLFLLLGFEIFSVVCLFSVMVGSFGGFNQVSLSKVLAYSSVLHIGWMLAGLGVSLSMGGQYYFVYFFMMVVLVFLLEGGKMLSVDQLMFGYGWVKIGVFLMMLSLGGFPPFLGFFPSWGVITGLLSSDLYLMVFLLFSSLVNLFYYFRLIYGGMFLKFLMVRSFGSGEGKWWLFFGVLFSSLGGVFYPLLF